MSQNMHIKKNAVIQSVVNEINQMASVDQKMRSEALQSGRMWDTGVDQRNTERMKEIVKLHGWPTSEIVGQEAAQNAWLLVQHADHDVAFQVHCLHLMKACSPTEVKPLNIAYLADRVRVNRGESQLFGTQGRVGENGYWDVLPIEDRLHVDERRASVGLESLDAYARFMNTKYGRASINKD